VGTSLEVLAAATTPSPTTQGGLGGRGGRSSSWEGGQLGSDGSSCYRAQRQLPEKEEEGGGEFISGPIS